MATNYLLKSSQHLQNLIQYFQHMYDPSKCKLLSYQHFHYRLRKVDHPLEQFQLNQLAAVGNIAQNTIDYNISTQDVEGEEQYLIAGNVKSQNDQHIIQLDPNGFKLNYDNWEVNPDNQIIFSNSGGIHADNFILRNGNSVIEIQSENQNLNSPLNINLKDFEIFEMKI